METFAKTIDSRVCPFKYFRKLISREYKLIYSFDKKYLDVLNMSVDLVVFVV